MDPKPNYYGCTIVGGVPKQHNARDYYLDGGIYPFPIHQDTEEMISRLKEIRTQRCLLEQELAPDFLHWVSTLPPHKTDISDDDGSVIFGDDDGSPPIKFIIGPFTLVVHTNNYNEIVQQICIDWRKHYIKCSLNKPRPVQDQKTAEDVVFYLWISRPSKKENPQPPDKITGSPAPEDDTFILDYHLGSHDVYDILFNPETDTTAQPKTNYEQPNENLKETVMSALKTMRATYAEAIETAIQIQQRKNPNTTETQPTNTTEKQPTNTTETQPTNTTEKQPTNTTEKQPTNTKKPKKKRAKKQNHPQPGD